MKGKKNNIINKAKKSFKSFMYKETTEKEPEKKDKTSLKKKIFEYGYYILIGIIICVILFINYRNEIENDKPVQGADYLEKKLEGDIKTINSGELTKYMIDNINNSYVKIAMTNIGDKVAYSLTYRYDVIPSGEVATNEYLSSGSMVSILINGYPNKSYEDMGVNSEEEAYLATQLAVYDLVSRMQYEGIANGEFSIDSITASEEQYEDMVTRVKEKAKELLNYALENPFEEDLNAIIDNNESKIKIKDGYSIYGPYNMETDTDEITKSFMGSEFNPTVEVNAKSFIENTAAVVTDKDGNELENVKNGENFYIKINSTNKIFSQFKLCATTYVLRARIYENNENNKKYVVLEPKNIEYGYIESIIKNLDSENIEINFKNYDGEILNGIKYYIYDENDQLIQDIDESGGVYHFDLPVGKYYIKIYEIPDGYFINGERFDFEVVKNQKNVLDIEVDSVLL